MTAVGAPRLGSAIAVLAVVLTAGIGRGAEAGAPVADAGTPPWKATIGTR